MGAIQKKTQATEAIQIVARRKLWYNGSGSISSIDYRFYVRKKCDAAGKSIGDGKAIATKKMPIFLNGLSGLLESHQCGEVYLGRMTHAISGELATTTNVYPKENAPRGKIMGLGYYLEAIATAHLLNNKEELQKKSPAQSIASVQTPAESTLAPRWEQLSKVSLPPKAPVREWLLGMGRGIRIAVEFSKKKMQI
ncbi:Uncharacterised protein [uncultured archaeon]|nr:Uncharacterised protein [uncultured archaeon]